MGNDVDVCSKDENIDSYFWDKHGRKDETTMQFFKRVYNKFCDSLVSPDRMLYNDGFLTRRFRGIDTEQFYEVLEFKVFSQEKTLHCCVWRCRPEPEPGLEKAQSGGSTSLSTSSSNPICILYMHNNIRCVADALEVLPLAHSMKASLFAFDLPGCGKSEGCLSCTIAEDIAHMIDWVKCLISPEVRIILWGRGMSTGPVIQFCATLASATDESCGPSDTAARSDSSDRSSFGSRGSRGSRGSWSFTRRRSSKTDDAAAATANSNKFDPTQPNMSINDMKACIQAVVLDSPFLGIEQIVVELVRKSQNGVLKMPKTIIRAGCKIVLHSLTKRLGGINPFKIRPGDLASACKLPCVVLAALEDDYIPAEHGAEVAARWGGPVLLRRFHGKQFDEREPGLSISTIDFLKQYVDGMDPATTSAVAAERLGVDMKAYTSAGNYSTLAGEKAQTSTSSSSVISDGELKGREDAVGSRLDERTLSTGSDGGMGRGSRSSSLGGEDVLLLSSAEKVELLSAAAAAALGGGAAASSSQAGGFACGDSAGAEGVEGAGRREYDGDLDPMERISEFMNEGYSIPYIDDIGSSGNGKLHADFAAAGGSASSARSAGGGRGAGRQTPVLGTLGALQDISEHSIDGVLDCSADSIEPAGADIDADADAAVDTNASDRSIAASCTGVGNRCEGVGEGEGAALDEDSPDGFFLVAPDGLTAELDPLVGYDGNEAEEKGKEKGKGAVSATTAAAASVTGAAWLPSPPLSKSTSRGKLSALQGML